jgi:RHO1 GDP-GTP exchange protein 1/2
MLIIDGGRKLAYGTDSGIYVSDRKPHSNAKTTPIRVHPLANVTQIDVLEEYGLLLVLCDKTLSSYPIELLTDHDNATNFQMNRRAKKVSGHVNFFKTGVCLGRVFLCVVKCNSMNSTIKVLEPVEGLNRGRTKLGFAKLLQGGQDFKVFKVSPSFFTLANGRNSIYLLNQRQFISSSRNCVLVVQRDSKLLILIIWKLSLCWIQQIPLSTLSLAKKEPALQSPSQYIDSTGYSCYVTTNLPSL